MHLLQPAGSCLFVLLRLRTMMMMMMMMMMIRNLYIGLSAGTVFIIIFCSVVFRRATKPKKSSSIPSPPSLPLLGNLHQLGSLPHRSLRDLSDKHGPLMLLHFGQVPTLIVSSAEAAHSVMKTHDLAFASRPARSMGKHLFYDSDVVFTPYGEYWRQVRRICVLHLLSLKRVQSFRSVRHEEVGLMISKIAASAAATSSQSTVNLTEMLLALTNGVVCRVACGKKISEKFGRMLADYTSLLGEIPIGDFIPCLSWVDWMSGLNSRARKQFHEMDDFLEKVLDEHQMEKSDGAYHNVSQKESFDFVTLLLSLDDTAAGITLTRDNMKAIILDMFVGGTDTTYTALEWTIAELIKHPEAMKRAQEEVRSIARPDREAFSLVSEDDIDRMSYLKAVIKESLRLHPPVPLLVPRESMQDIQLQGYDVPARTRVMINAWAIGRDPKSWPERPEDFWPDRFLINSCTDFRGNDFSLIPFGAGRRGCPGIGFAIPIIELALANLLHHFDWAMPDGKDLDMSEKSGITVPKKSNLILVAIPQLLKGAGDM